MRLSLANFIVIGILSIVQAASDNNQRLLILIDNPSEKSNYSKFIADLEGRGFQISIDTPKNEKSALFELDERAYDHLAIFPCKSKGLGPNFTPQLLLEFINRGGNILLTLTSTRPTPTTIVSLLLELDIHLPNDRNSLLVDHFNHDVLSSNEKHDVILMPRPDAIRPDVKNFFRGDGIGGEVIAFPRGVGQTLGNDSPLLTPILRAPRTAYSYSSKEENNSVQDPFAVGPQLSLISALQARNSARLTVIGSAEMLEDTWFDATVKRSIGLGGIGSNGKELRTSNQAFAKEVTGWTFKEIGTLKVGQIKHNLQEVGAQTELENPRKYRVKNDVTYSIEISEYSWDKWVPYNPPPGDEIQLEFSMLSPFQRLNLKSVSSNENSTVFSTSFRLPDQHGIFNFMVNYKRPFLSNIQEKDTVTVRHFAHNEWPRSWVITGAWPWIAGIGVTVLGWIAFIALWLWSKPQTSRNPSEKKLQ
ncbi:Dolichyl-diphosphooligosaccharide--protein glycosyltransferase subunit wbp1 [Golovinomyces cichoracearum]|uniref:Dolichyl-diphosphooligosaccharide--protein glycosyltransferase subunit WBP1 n=1 Tax=Golovinomyces cichoracearum TaxID=62708 RepID=A0A420IWK7_9PEZI|nr:Dolichyl-diphosphooligosaccharide--protein glycosyltransferase subunit wbp1 [Golovinomyces cichoracearum]